MASSSPAPSHYALSPHAMHVHGASPAASPGASAAGPMDLRTFEAAVLYSTRPDLAPSPDVQQKAVMFLQSLGNVPHAWQLLPQLLVTTSEGMCRFYALQGLERFIRSSAYSELPDATRVSIREGLIGWIRDRYAPAVLQTDDASVRSRLALAVALLIKHEYPRTWPDPLADIIGAFTPAVAAAFVRALPGMPEGAAGYASVAGSVAAAAAAAAVPAGHGDAHTSSRAAAAAAAAAVAAGAIAPTSLPPVWVLPAFQSATSISASPITGSALHRPHSDTSGSAIMLAAAEQAGTIVRILRELDDEIADPRFQSQDSARGRALAATVKNTMRVDGSCVRAVQFLWRMLEEATSVLESTTASSAGLAMATSTAAQALTLAASLATWIDIVLMTDTRPMGLLARLVRAGPIAVRSAALRCLTAVADKGMPGTQRATIFHTCGLVDATRVLVVTPIDRDTDAATARARASPRGPAPTGGIVPTHYPAEELAWARAVCLYVSTLGCRLGESLVEAEVLAAPDTARGCAGLLARCADSALSLCATAPFAAATELVPLLRLLSERARDEALAASALASHAARSRGAGPTLPSTATALPAAHAASAPASSSASPSSVVLAGTLPPMRPNVSLAHRAAMVTGMSILSMATRLVDAALAASRLPLTHTFSFDSEVDARCVELRDGVGSAVIECLSEGGPDAVLRHLLSVCGTQLSAPLGPGVSWQAVECALHALLWMPGRIGKQVRDVRTSLPLLADVLIGVIRARPWAHPHRAVAEAGIEIIIKYLPALPGLPPETAGLVLAALSGGEGLKRADTRIAVRAAYALSRTLHTLCRAPGGAGHSHVAPHAPHLLAALHPCLFIPLPSAAASASSSSVSPGSGGSLLPLSLPELGTSDTGAALSLEARVHVFESVGTILGQSWVPAEQRLRYVEIAIGPTLRSLADGLASLRAAAPPGTPDAAVCARLAPSYARTAHEWCASAIGAMTHLVKGLSTAATASAVSPELRAIVARVVEISVEALRIFPGPPGSGDGDEDDGSDQADDGRGNDGLLSSAPSGPVRDDSGDLGVASSYHTPGRGSMGAASVSSSASVAAGGAPVSGSPPTGRSYRRSALLQKPSAVRERVRQTFQVMITILGEPVLPLMAPALPILFETPSARELGLVLALVSQTVRSLGGRAAPLLRGGALPRILSRVFALLPAPETVAATSEVGQDSKHLLFELLTMLRHVADGGPALSSVFHDSAEAVAALPALVSAVAATAMRPDVAGVGGGEQAMDLRCQADAVLACMLSAWWPGAGSSHLTAAQQHALLHRPGGATEPVLPSLSGFLEQAGGMAGAATTVAAPAPSSTGMATGSAAAGSSALDATASSMDAASLARFQGQFLETAVPAMLGSLLVPEWRAGDHKSSEAARIVAWTLVALLCRAGTVSGPGAASANPFAVALAARILPTHGVPAVHATAFAEGACARSASGDWAGVARFLIDLITSVRLARGLAV